MNNKKIISLVLSVLMVLPATVYAKGNKENDKKENGNGIVQFVDKMQKDLNSYIQHKDGNNSDSENKNQEVKQVDQQSKDAKKQEIEQFKAQMQAKHEQMSTIRQQTIEQKNQIEQKKAQLKSIVSDLLAGKKTLSDDMVQSLITASEDLKKDAELINATAEIKNEINDTQDKINKKDFNNALTSMDKVIARLQQRLDALKKLNADLDAALAIANNAVVPAPTTTPDPTNTNTTTTTGTDTTQTSTTTTTDSNTQQTATN
jgi:chromosome segregation ATPase